MCVILHPSEKTLDQLPLATGLKFKLFPRTLRAQRLTLVLFAVCLVHVCSYFPMVVFAVCRYKNTLASDVCVADTSITSAKRLSLICFIFFVVLLITHDPVYLFI